MSVGFVKEIDVEALIEAWLKVNSSFDVKTKIALKIENMIIDISITPY